jgi:hypothetical protein
VSGRRFLDALVAGERSPAALAALGDGRLKATPQQLADALTGRFRDIHAFEIATHLRLIDTINDEIARLDARIEQQLAAVPGVAPACTDCGLLGGGHAPGCASDGEPVPGLVERLDEITGVGTRNAQVIIAELGTDMSVFPTADPQDHIHNQFTRMVQTASDGCWRALDTIALRGVLGAISAVVAARAEAALTARYGVEWVPRADGRGHEIKGVTQQEMDTYPTRTVAVRAAERELAREWAAAHGREPNSRELLHIAQTATMASRKGKEHGRIDWDALARRWDATLGGELAAIAPRVSRLGPGARDPDATDNSEPAEVTEHAKIRAVQHALYEISRQKSTWTRFDLIKRIGHALPAEARRLTPDAAHQLVLELAERALSGEIEDVACLDAPEWPPLPASLRRDLDGRTVYTRPGTSRYATRVQLSLEERLLADAQRHAAPRLERDACAQLLGASAEVLDAALRDASGHAAQEPRDHALRMDQTAALFHVLTSPRTAEVMVGPAGSGKTRALAEAARLWQRAGRGEVWGLATSQAARNVLAEAGVKMAANTAVFLGHLPGQRGALGVTGIRPGTLLLIDEASMTSMPDLAEITAHAARQGAKVLICGDQEQTSAVESGGGMMLMARRLGYVQLAEPVRFREQWERDASLRLRAGDPSAWTTTTSTAGSAAPNRISRWTRPSAPTWPAT